MSMRHATVVASRGEVKIAQLEGDDGE